MALYLYEHSYTESAIDWTWGPPSLLARLLFPVSFFQYWAVENCQLLRQILFYIMLSIFLLFFFIFFQKQKMVKIKNKNKNKKPRDARPKNSFSLKPSPGKIVYRRRHLITLHHCKILIGQYVLLTRVLVLLSLKWYSHFLPPVQPPEDKSRHFNQSLFLSSKSRRRSGIYIKF